MIPDYIYTRIIVFIVLYFFIVQYFRMYNGTNTRYSYQCLKCDAYYETKSKIILELFGVYHKVTCRSARARNVEEFEERVKAMVMKRYNEKGIKPSCERCDYISDPTCPDFPHICARAIGR